MTNFPLTALRLRFECEAITPIQLGGLKAGSNLRGALVNIMRRAACPRSFTGETQIDPQHAASCPVCWLVAANDHPGEERRGYTLTPPLEPHILLNGLRRGERFSFHITLFGEAARYLPYFVLAVPEAGRIGVGVGRGAFALSSIWAEHPALEQQPVLRAGEKIVRPPQNPIRHADLLALANSRFSQKNVHLRLTFSTPLRLIVSGKLLKTPDFGAFFALLLKRLDDLAQQHADGASRPAAECEALWGLANRVRLLENDTRWDEVQSGSSRTGQKTFISGLVGSARYSAAAEVWRELLPWLLWGEITQVGKDAVKGNGVFRVVNDE